MIQLFNFSGETEFIRIEILYKFIQVQHLQINLEVSPLLG